MDQSDRKNPPPRKRGVDWLDPSSAWTQDEYGALSAAASEPYDWTLKDGETRATQVIPITSPVRRRSPKFQWLKRKANAPESSTLIPLEKGATRKLLAQRITRLIRPAATVPLVESGRTGVSKQVAERTQSSATIPLVESDRAGVNKQAAERTQSAATVPLVERGRTRAGRKSPGLALPLLLLSVIALFIFAYIAQK
jgi:hypothetical protein